MFVWCNCTLGKDEVVLLQALYHAAPDYIHIQDLELWRQNFNALHCPHYQTSVYDLNFIHAYKKYLQLHAETGVLVLRRLHTVESMAS